MAQIVSDDFNRADSASLGANWTSYIDSNSIDHTPAVVSNQASAGAHFDSYAKYSGAGWTGGADQYAEITPKFTSGGEGLGPLVRCNFTNSTSTFQAYLAYIDVVGSSSSAHQLYRLDSGSGSPTFVALGSPFTLTISNTDVVRIEAQGTTIRYLVNGVTKQTFTDSTYNSGNPGIHLEQNSAGNTDKAVADNFAAGDFSAGGGGTVVKPLAALGVG